MTKTKTSSKKSQKPQKNQKTHRGLKITAAIATVLILIFGGFAAWFFVYYNSPEKVAFDAIENLLTSDNVGFEGGFTFWFSDEEKENSPITGALLSFDSSSNQLPASNTAKFQLLFNSEKVPGEPRFILTLENVILRNGVLYFQIGGIMDSLESFSMSGEEWLSVEDYIPLLETIDNEWWQIDVNQIISELELSASQKDTATQIYSCIVEALNRNNSQEMAKLYREHRFIDVTPSKKLAPEGYTVEVASWHNAYEVSLDKVKLVDFLNAIPETATANEFYACFNAVENQAVVPLALDASDFDEISVDDLTLPDNLRIFMEVSTFGHKLRSAYVYQDTDKYELSVAMLIKYQNVTITAPDNYRPITDLIEEFIELLKEV